MSVKYQPFYYSIALNNTNHLALNHFLYICKPGVTGLSKYNIFSMTFSHINDYIIVIFIHALGFFYLLARTINISFFFFFLFPCVVAKTPSSDSCSASCINSIGPLLTPVKCFFPHKVFLA